MADSGPWDNYGSSGDSAGPWDSYSEKSLGGLGMNALKDIPEVLGSPFRQVAEAGKNLTQTGLEMSAAPFTGEKYAETPWAKQTADLAKNALPNAQAMMRPATHPIDFAYEHPIQQGLNILGLGMGAKSLMGGKPPIVSPEVPPEVPPPPPPPSIVTGKQCHDRDGETTKRLLR